MPEFARFGGKRGRRYELVDRTDLLVVRTRSRRPVEDAPLRPRAREALRGFAPWLAFPEAGVEVLRCPRDGAARARRDRARAALSSERGVEFAGRVLAEPESGLPVLYTENLFVRFAPGTPRRVAAAALRAHGLAVQRETPLVDDGYFAAAPPGTGRETFAVARRLLARADVTLCHPELVTERRRKAAFPGQWHLEAMRVGGRAIEAHASVTAAWPLSTGRGATVAVIDDGCDVRHREFAARGKVVAARDVTLRRRGAAHRVPYDPATGEGEAHGTACAGVAVASGRAVASGVAPDARLLPIRCASPLGSKDEADAFAWAVKHGADVISCSWGPPDGDFGWAGDPMHLVRFPLSDFARLAIEAAATQGRAGRGCVVTWAAGNGGESVDLDGYASHPSVLAVAACDDVSRASRYSDRGRAVFCAFPSDDDPPSRHAAITTTDRRGREGYDAGDVTHDFGGTSSACPGVAGVAALVLSVRPDLRATDVRDVIARTCDRIDPRGGRYGRAGRSLLYGFGRVNARRAVEAALALPHPRGGRARVSRRGSGAAVPTRCP